MLLSSHYYERILSYYDLCNIRYLHQWTNRCNKKITAMRVTYFVMVILLSIITGSCVIRVCNTSFIIDHGKAVEPRYTMIKTLDYAIQVIAQDSILDVNIFSSKSKNILVKNRGVILIVNEIDLFFPYTKDSLLIINNEERHYTCEDFKEKLKSNSKLNLRFNYSIDSSGVIKNYINNYSLVKKKNCHLTFRVH